MPDDHPVSRYRRTHPVKPVKATGGVVWWSQALERALFAGSDRCADPAAVLATLIMTAKLNDIVPQAWLADVLTLIACLPQGRLHELLPGNWSAHVRPIVPPQAA